MAMVEAVESCVSSDLLQKSHLPKLHATFLFLLPRAADQPPECSGDSSTRTPRESMLAVVDGYHELDTNYRIKN